MSSPSSKKEEEASKKHKESSGVDRDDYKKTLTKTFDYIVENTTDLETIFQKLYIKNVLTANEMEELRSYPVTNKQIFELIRIMSRKGEANFQIFKDVLAMSGNGHVAHELLANEGTAGMTREAEEPEEEKFDLL